MGSYDKLPRQAATENTRAWLRFGDRDVEIPEGETIAGRSQRCGVILDDPLVSRTHARIVSTKEGFKWDWSEELALDRMLWFIARSAADLLTSGNLDRVRQCGDEECGWLFIDTTKNRSRRWCDMTDCGNRAKARRHYSRLRASSKS